MDPGYESRQSSYLLIETTVFEIRAARTIGFVQTGFPIEGTGLISRKISLLENVCLRYVLTLHPLRLNLLGGMYQHDAGCMP